MSLFGFKGRDWTQEETPEGARIVIPAPRLWPIAAFFALWLAGWTAGEVSAVKQLWGLFSGGGGAGAVFAEAFMLFWLAGWTVGGAFAWGVFLFSLDGREVLTVREDKFCVRLETFLGLGWTWRFDIPGMAPPRLVAAGPGEGVAAGGQNPLAGLRLVYVAIESGGRKWKLGAGLLEQRAKDLLYALNSRFGLPRERRG